MLKIRELVDDDATIACDVGSHYIYMARHFRGYQPRRVLFSDGQQTLGVALPWAMAAAMVRPGTQVVSVSGDGGFLFSAQELETATRLGLALHPRHHARQRLRHGRLPRGRSSTVAPRVFNWATTTSPNTRQRSAPKGSGSTAWTSSSTRLKQSLTDTGITIIDVPVDYSRNTELFAQLHDRVLD